MAAAPAMNRLLVLSTVRALLARPTDAGTIPHPLRRCESLRDEQLLRLCRFRKKR